MSQALGAGKSEARTAGLEEFASYFGRKKTESQGQQAHATKRVQGMSTMANWKGVISSSPPTTTTTQDSL
jgi:hypothetical protein